MELKRLEIMNVIKEAGYSQAKAFDMLNSYAKMVRANLDESIYYVSAEEAKECEIVLSIIKKYKMKKHLEESLSKSNEIKQKRIKV